MEHVVQFPSGQLPTLSWLMALLAEQNYPVQMRMVDGDLTLPDEAPPGSWTEVRLGTPDGMVTLQRRGHEMRVVTWGSADPALVRAWNALTWAVAMAGEGEIVGPGMVQNPEDFRRAVPMPEVLRP